ncbi:MAG: PepSY domain-containing protein [Acidobacteriota bacterium]
MKIWLIVIHRWLGFAGCLLFALWFGSGLVMMYVEMPYLQRTAERLEGLVPLDASAPLLTPWQAIDRSGLDTSPANLRLVSRATAKGAHPVWELEGGSLPTLDAVTGEILPAPTLEDATAAVRRWNPEAAFQSTADVDQWTLPRSQFAAHRPLHRFADERGEWLYASSVTGAVVQRVSRGERLWATAGPVAHWLYPTFLRRRAALWNRVVVITSLLCTVAVVTGLALGLWHLRRRSPHIPYREPTMRRHHLFGLIFGFFAFTWTLSGLFSMEPVPVPSSGATAEQKRLWQGDVGWPAFQRRPDEVLAVLRRPVKELRLRFFDGDAYWLATSDEGETQLLSDRELHLVEALPASSLRPVAEGLLPAATLTDWQRLDDYDLHYTSKATSPTARPLPVYRARYDDAESTVLYVDPATAELVLRVVDGRRLVRILYQGLHSWNLFGFHNLRPLWDLVVGAAMIGGLILSVTGVQLSWRLGKQRLRRRRRPKV